ncbi:M20/M25/M40 family metallo-hydrolase [Parvularcula dongshanensis]|uniref:Zn-dependent M28 family amino/carboxypeptidase n=1 Tax=Parvularcula dongshanensis TaxID=1173995 RepID=A0A840I6J2_9PROT|nr:M20/M25/M40 family metallo-hydrolase [Parvularcula dongshanensis]MBB4659748.1 Zn-dependent M28 family amino/carboxypeptidase [Parvularcula dongshanensis]
MKLLPRTASVLALLTAAACATTGGNDAERRFKADLTTLASDAYEGREAGTRGYDLAVDYVVAQFRQMGVEPAGEDGYLQDVPLRRAYRGAPGTALATFEGPDEDLTLTDREDFLLDAPSLSDPGAEDAIATAEGGVVFAGYGIDAPSLGIDSYAGIDAAGKVVLLLQGAPDGLPSEEAAHFQSTTTKIAAAAARGASAVLVLGSAAEETPEMRARMARYADMPANTFAGRDAGHEDVVTGHLSGSAAMRLFEAAGEDLDAAATPDEAGRIAAIDLGGTMTLRAEGRFENYTAPNVVGMIEGSDPELKGEYVVLSAHLDHVGIDDGEHAKGADVIHNGAMDNASGIATMLEAARRFTTDEERPRRSVLFVAVTAEEKGLLGSEYFASNPTVPQGAMVADVNLDMPILMHDFTDVIAFGAQHSTLQDIVAEAAEGMDVTLAPDPVPEMVLFVRSDHYSFVKEGVPSVFLFLGFSNGGEQSFRNFMSTHYHQVSDSPRLPIRYDVGARFAELNYRIAKAIANADERPEWNRGDFFGDLYAGDEAAVGAD